MSVKLTWSHYCELLGVFDKDARRFYEKEAKNSNWSVRENELFGKDLAIRRSWNYIILV
ncbi:MAG TPA: DUF1016 N-terminal domain-containing protein [Ruminiclostridium sp.]